MSGIRPQKCDRPSDRVHDQRITAHDPIARCRFKIADGGKKLDIAFTADDPRAFYQPWGAIRPRFLVRGDIMGEGDDEAAKPACETSGSERDTSSILCSNSR